ncbi:MAG: zinc ribbon domain-containing protein [Ruminococcaceae bacterium]|jgi:hypothetical protein|nr:zinc ribbon domain-containing protein [Oscillospiraceae bacterium]
MFCTECGKPVKNDYKFCPHCGAPRDKDLMENPGEETFPRASETWAVEESPADHADAADGLYSETARTQDPEAEEPSEPEVESRDWSASRFEISEEDDLDPPLSFSYEEEPPRRSAQNPPYFIYHPDPDRHKVKTGPREKPDRLDLHADESAKRSPIAFSPAVSRGPSWGIKVLVILAMVALALVASVFGYQYLFASKPFEPGWFFGLHFVL